MGITAALVVLLIMGVIALAITWATNTLVHGCRERLDHINPTGEPLISATDAMSLDAEGKREIEDWIYEQCKNSELYRNTSRDDIRAVQHWLGVKYRDKQPAQLVAQSREMQNW
jgi:hypothetical protein